MPYLTEEWGNPSSTYKFGSRLKTAIEVGRAQVAQLIGGAGTRNCVSRHAAQRATIRRFMRR